MFSNVGGKIQVLAKVLFVIGIVASVGWGLTVFRSYRGGEAIFFGILSILIGALSSWVGSWFLHGFGEIVENSEKMVYYLNYLEKTVEKIKDNENSKL